MNKGKNIGAFFLSLMREQLFRGFFVGIVVGGLITSFRFLIEFGSRWIFTGYQKAPEKPWLLIIIFLIYLIYLLVYSQLVKSEESLKGSGVALVEAELNGGPSQDYWSLLWKKLTMGAFSISSGLMLGRGGPSIYLGALAGKKLSKYLQTEDRDTRHLIASGAAAGLSAIYNAPLAGFLFVIEGLHYRPSNMVWPMVLIASLVSHTLSQLVFGATPVLAIPEDLVAISRDKYWIYMILGLFLGSMAHTYNLVVPKILRIYDWLARSLCIKSYYNSFLAFIFILPIGYYLPELLGGGNRIIPMLTIVPYPLEVLVAFFLIRFAWTMISYGGGLPGGIFLPTLTLGALLGAIVGSISIHLGGIEPSQFSLFIIVGMGAYLAPISKAPLTAIIMVMELVGNHSHLLPLGVTTFISYGLVKLLEYKQKAL